MEGLSVHEIEYNNNLFFVKVIDKIEVSGSKLAVLSVTMEKDNNSLSLGNFYTKLPNLVSDDDMYDFVKNLIDNIDEIIFKKNRYIGDNYESATVNSADSTLVEIYSEFSRMPKDSIDYIKYSYFLELYFNGHSIPDSIKKVFLERNSKSILDFDDIDSAIKSEFHGNIGELKEKKDYENNTKYLESLDKELKERKEEIDLLLSMINKIKEVLSVISENEKINTSIDELKSKLKSTSIFSKSRKELKKAIKNLRNSLKIIDIKENRNKLFELYSNYAAIYKDTRGLLVLFDNLSLEDTLSLLDDIYKTRNLSYNDIIRKRDNIKNEISNYTDKFIDISDLYERLESK